MSYSGIVWRHIPEGGDPFDFFWLVTADGRWNRPGKYGALYTSLSRKGALAEYRKARMEMGPAYDPRELIKINVSEIKPILDLTDGTVRNGKFNLNLQDITADTARSYDICRSIADYAKLHNIMAIKTPSAAASGGVNLNIFQWGPWEDAAKPTVEDRIEITDELIESALG